MSLVKLSWACNKEDRPGPEVLIGVMILQPWPNGVSFANVKRFSVALWTRAEQEVDASLLKLYTVADLRIQGAREDDGFADPVGAFDKPQAVGVPIGHED